MQFKVDESYFDELSITEQNDLDMYSKNNENLKSLRSELNKLMRQLKIVNPCCPAGDNDELTVLHFIPTTFGANHNSLLIVYIQSRPARVGRLVRRTISINLIVRSDVLQQDCFGTFVLDELENEPQVVTGTTGPGTR